VNLKVPIAVCDEMTEFVVESTASLDLASGEIRDIEYRDYDVESQGLPADRDDYEFTSGVLSSNGKDVEFRVDVEVFSGKYSISANELLELKVRAAKLFAGIEAQALLDAAPARRARTAAPKKPH